MTTSPSSGVRSLGSSRRPSPPFADSGSPVRRLPTLSHPRYPSIFTGPAGALHDQLPVFPSITISQRPSSHRPGHVGALQPSVRPRRWSSSSWVRGSGRCPGTRTTSQLRDSTPKAHRAGRPNRPRRGRGRRLEAPESSPGTMAEPGRVSTPRRPAKSERRQASIVPTLRLQVPDVRRIRSHNESCQRTLVASARPDVRRGRSQIVEPLRPAASGRAGPRRGGTPHRGGGHRVVRVRRASNCRPLDPLLEQFVTSGPACRGGPLPGRVDVGAVRSRPSRRRDPRRAPRSGDNPTAVERSRYSAGVVVVPTRSGPIAIPSRAALSATGLPRAHRQQHRQPLLARD